MKHVYLSEIVVNDAFKQHKITSKEADKLKKKIHTQSSISKFIRK